MLIGQKGVKYGLTVRGKPKPAAPPPKLAAFSTEDSDGEEDGVGKQIARQAARKRTDSKTAQMHAAALAEDASIFDYDGVYEEVSAARSAPQQQQQQQRAERKSRYIETLMDKAKEREKEQNILYERKLLKERQAEDTEFGDTERFLTSAYRRKLQEDKRWLAEEKLREEVEKRNDVVKRGHMGDFFRNVMSNNVAMGTASAAPARRTAGASASGPSTADREAAAGEAGPSSGAGDAAPGPALSPAAQRAAEEQDRLAQQELAAMLGGGRGGGPRGGAVGGSGREARRPEQLDRPREDARSAAEPWGSTAQERPASSRLDTDRRTAEREGTARGKGEAPGPSSSGRDRREGTAAAPAGHEEKAAGPFRETLEAMPAEKEEPVEEAPKPVAKSAAEKAAEAKERYLARKRKAGE